MQEHSHAMLKHLRVHNFLSLPLYDATVGLKSGVSSNREISDGHKLMVLRESFSQ